MPTEAQDIGFVPDDVDVGFVPDGPTPEQAQAEMDRMKARNLAEGITFGQSKFRATAPPGPFPWIVPTSSEPPMPTPEPPVQGESLRAPTPKERIALTPIGEFLGIGRAPEREIAQQYGGSRVMPQDIMDTMFKFMSVPPQAAKPIEQVTEPVFKSLPPSIGGTLSGIRDVALQFPIAGGAVSLGKNVGKALLAGFTLDWLLSKPEEYAQAKAALDRGDSRTAYKLLAETIAGGALLGLGAKHEISKFRTPAGRGEFNETQRQAVEFTESLRHADPQKFGELADEVAKKSVEERQRIAVEGSVLPVPPAKREEPIVETGAPPTKATVGKTGALIVQAAERPAEVASAMKEEIAGALEAGKAAPEAASEASTQRAGEAIAKADAIVQEAGKLLPKSAKALSSEEQAGLRGELEAIDPEAYTQKGVQDATIRQRISEEIPLEVLPETSEKVGAQVREQASEVKAQESQVSDRTRYNEIQSEMSAMIEKGDMESPEFRALWQENEAIKNRHGGMPPEEIPGDVAESWIREAVKKPEAATFGQAYDQRLKVVSEWIRKGETPEGPIPEHVLEALRRELKPTRDLETGETLDITSGEGDWPRTGTLLDFLESRSQSRAPELEATSPILTPAVQAEGRTFTGKNHGEAIVAAARSGVDATTAEHVFLDSAGNVLNRADAAKVFTEKTGKTPSKPEGLHSEDLRDAGMLEGVTQGELKTEAQNLAGPGGTTPADVGQGTNLKQLEGALATLPGDPNAPGYWQQTIRDSFNVGKTMSQAKDTLGAGLNGLLAMGTRLKQKVTGFEKFTPWLKALGENQAARQQSSLEARQFANRVVRDMPALRDRKTREAITKWVDAGGDNAILAKAAAEVPQGKRAPYERALKLTPDEVMAGRQIQQYFEARLQQAIDAGILENGIADYIHRTYEKSSKWKDGVIAELQTGRLSTVKPALARKRIFEYDFEAEKAGYSPKNDFLERILDYDQSLNKAIADHNMVQNAMKITMSDGRPMFDVAGDAQQITTKGGKEEVIVRAQTKRRSEDPKKNRSDYVAFDHPALRKAKWVLTDENGQPIILKGDAIVHPDAVKQVNAVLGKSRVRSWEPLGVPVGRGALAVGSAIKQTMLDLSGFHMVQIGVHGVEHMTNPFRLVELNLSEPSQAFLVKHGLNVADYHGYQMFTEGNAGSALHKLPGAGPLLQAQHEWLFKDFIPRVKMTMAEHALERNRARFQKELKSGKMTEDDLGYLTAQQSNAAFGGLNYEMLARSPTMRDLSRLALLAPDFLEARGRFAGQAFTKYGREQTRALVTGAIGLYVLARIANKIVNDDYHWEPENIFSLVHNGRSYSLRTVQGDIMHLLSDPARFWFNRLNPVYGRTGMEALTQRDAFGRKRDWKQQLQDFALTAMPISLRSSKEQRLFASILNAFGVTNKRWDAIAQTYKLAEPYRKLSPGEFIYDPDKDPFREVKLDLTGGYDGDAVEDLKKLVAKGTPLAQIDRHFFTYARSPFTGSASSEKRFVNGLTGPQKRIYEAALAEKRTLLERYNKARQAVK